MIREWGAKLISDGMSVSMAAKAYRLLRAVLMTAVEEDKSLTRTPCRIRGAGDEDAAERPVLTVAQVLELGRACGSTSGRQHPQDPGGRLPAARPAAWRDAHVTRGLRHAGRRRACAV